LVWSRFGPVRSADVTRPGRYFMYRILTCTRSLSFIRLLNTISSGNQRRGLNWIYAVSKRSAIMADRDIQFFALTLNRKKIYFSYSGYIDLLIYFWTILSSGT
jgi:hypothetical protein